MNAANTWVTLV